MVIVFSYILIYIFGTFPGVLSYLEILLRVYDVPGTIMLALPLAYALGSLLNFFLIWILFKKDFLRGTSSHLEKTFIQSMTAALVMGVVAYVALGVFDDIFTISTGKGIFFQGLFSGLIGISFGVFTLAIMKNKELADLAKALSHKFWRGRVVAPEQGEL